MPQMAPLWWLTLMLMFSISLTIMNNYIYFNKTYNSGSKNLFIKKISLSWKW